jgi:hypothetical protein
MKTAVIIFLSFFLYAGSTFAQTGSLEPTLIRLKGLPLDSKKEAIVAKFGKPKKVFEPKHECGFRSEAEQGKKYYQLAYDHLAFVGNETEKYGIEYIDFNPKSNLTLDYGKSKLNHTLTLKEFEKIFGKTTREKADDHGVTDVMLYFKNADDALVFSFKSGYLVKVHYWSPC